MRYIQHVVDHAARFTRIATISYTCQTAIPTLRSVELLFHTVCSNHIEYPQSATAHSVYRLSQGLENQGTVVQIRMGEIHFFRV
jgi:hypothetical protein